MTTASELLDITASIESLNRKVDTINKEKSIANENQGKLKALLRALDKDNDIYGISLVLQTSSSGHIKVELDAPLDRLEMDKIVSILTEMLAIRTANAMAALRETAAKIGE